MEEERKTRRGRRKTRRRRRKTRRRRRKTRKRGGGGGGGLSAGARPCEVIDGCLREAELNLTRLTLRLAGRGELERGIYGKGVGWTVHVRVNWGGSGWGGSSGKKGVLKDSGLD